MSQAETISLTGYMNLWNQLVSSILSVDTYLSKISGRGGHSQSGYSDPISFERNGESSNSSQLDLVMPEEWSAFCSVDRRYVKGSNFTPKNVLYIQCVVGPNNTWTFHSFRNWTDRPDADPVVKYALDLTCRNGGKLSLPWPMRAKQLWYLSVRSCDIVDYMLDYGRFNLSSVPVVDLAVLDIADSNIIVDIMTFVSYAHKLDELHKGYDCGSEVLEKYVFRNVTKHFINMDKLNMLMTKDDVVSHAGKVVGSKHHVTHTCHYNDMMYMDESISTTTSAHQSMLMTRNSAYPKLQFLNFTYQGLPTLPEIFRKWGPMFVFPDIRYVDLSHNNISEFPHIKDDGLLTETATLDLRYNNISVITQKDIDSLKQLKTVRVDIRENPFRCDCDMKAFVEYLQGNFENASGTILVNGDNYLFQLTCAKPIHLLGAIISHLPVANLGCEASDLLPLLDLVVVLSVTVVLLVVLIFAIVRYRKEIIILAFTRLNIVSPCQKVEQADAKQYDVFVSYHSDDYQWIVNILAPRLENPPSGSPFKLCLHQRDFEVGAAIADNIVRSVENSRHTVMVLSPKFVTSEWCFMEFQTAFHQSLLEKKKHLVIVILEEVPLHDMHSDLRRCLQTFTYVKVNDRWFWDKLFYALSDKQQKRLKTKELEPEVNMLPVIAKHAVAKPLELNAKELPNGLLYNPNVNGPPPKIFLNDEPMGEMMD